MNIVFDLLLPAFALIIRFAPIAILVYLILSHSKRIKDKDGKSRW